MSDLVDGRELPRNRYAQQSESWWHDPRGWPLASWGLLLILSGFAHLILWALTGGPWEGPITWRKPILFGISGGLTSLSMGWAWSYLPPWRFDRLIAWIATLALVIEVFLIDLQCWRGVASHFNRSTPTDAILYDLMSWLILFVTAVIVFITVRAFCQPISCSVDLRLAMQAGLIYLVISCLLGIWVGANGDLRMQAGLPPEQFGEAGVPKFPHGVVIHALQWLPLLAWGARQAGYSEKTRLRIVSIAGRATGLLLIYAFGVTLMGKARFDPPASLATLLFIAVAGLIIPAAYVTFGCIKQWLWKDQGPPVQEA